MTIEEFMLYRSFNIVLELEIKIIFINNQKQKQNR